MDMIPETFHFLRPLWLSALLPTALLIGLALRREKTGNSWRALVDPHLLRHLVVSEGYGRHRWPLYLAALVGLATTLAMAGPTWEKTSIPGEIGQTPTVIALDMSASMDQTDLSPSRLARARYEIFDLLAANADQQNGLVVYAEEPFVAVPLTEDIQVIEEMVPLLATELMPGSGSRADRAIREAAELLAQADSGSGHIILLSDQPEARSEDVRAARAARDQGFRVSAIGFGENDTGLREIVRAGGGSFAQTRADSLDIDTVLVDSVSYGLGEQDAQLTLEVWTDAGIWLVFVPLLLAPLAFRRGWLLALLLSLGLQQPQPAEAGLWDDLWASRNEQGAVAFDENRKSDAAELFENPDWRAAALYGAGDYETAAESYSQLEGNGNLYNHANALARQGDLQTALARYEDVLSNQPDHADATFNRDLVKSLIEQQEQEEQQDQEGSEDDSSEGKESEQEGEPQDGEESSEDGEQQGEKSGEPSDESSRNGEASDPADSDESDASEQEVEEAARDEQELADEVDKALAEAEQEADQPGSQRDQQMARMNEEITEEAQAREQKLRQIPQDPAGLLRAKIRRRYAERRYQTEGY